MQSPSVQGGEDVNPPSSVAAIRASASRFSDVTRMLVCISRVCALLRAYRGIHLRHEITSDTKATILVALEERWR